MSDTHTIREINQQELATLGLRQVAYVKPMVIDGQPVWCIHAADGTRVGAVASREAALINIIQNDLEPLSVH